MTFMARDLLMGGAGNGVAISDPNHPNMIAMFTMDNISGSTLFDETSNNVDGTIVGATAVSGKVGDSLSFDGNDTVKHSTWSVPSGSFAIAVWLKIPVTHNSEMTPLNEYHTADGRRSFLLDLADTSGTVRYRVTGDGNFSGLREVSTSTGQNDNAWHFYVLNLESSTELALFVDAAEIDTNTTSIPSGPFTGTGEDLKLGHYTAGGGAGSPAALYTGEIDQLRFYDRILTQGEIDTLYNSGAGI